MTENPPQHAHSQRYIDALGWAAELHRFQQRKGKPVPYISHLIAVTSPPSRQGRMKARATDQECGGGYVSPAIGSGRNLRYSIRSGRRPGGCRSWWRGCKRVWSWWADRGPAPRRPVLRIAAPACRTDAADQRISLWIRGHDPDGVGPKSGNRP